MHLLEALEAEGAVALREGDARELRGATPVLLHSLAADLKIVLKAPNCAADDDVNVALKLQEVNRCARNLQPLAQEVAYFAAVHRNRDDNVRVAFRTRHLNTIHMHLVVGVPERDRRRLFFEPEVGEGLDEPGRRGLALRHRRPPHVVVAVQMPRAAVLAKEVTRCGLADAGPRRHKGNADCRRIRCGQHVRAVSDGRLTVERCIAGCTGETQFSGRVLER